MCGSAVLHSPWVQVVTVLAVTLSRPTLGSALQDSGVCAYVVKPQIHGLLWAGKGLQDHSVPQKKSWTQGR